VSPEGSGARPGPEVRPGAGPGPGSAPIPRWTDRPWPGSDGVWGAGRRSAGRVPWRRASRAGGAARASRGIPTHPMVETESFRLRRVRT